MDCQRCSVLVLVMLGNVLVFRKAKLIPQALVREA